MRYSSTKSRAACITAAAVLAVAGYGVSAAQAAFTIDLQVHGGGTSTTIAPGTVLTLDVFGTVTAGTNDGIQDAFFGVVNGGTVGDLSTVTLQNPFNGIATDATGVTTSSSGLTYGAAGSTSVGSTNSAVADGWVFARSTSMTPVAANTQTLLGSLTYTAGSTAGSATLTINPRSTAGDLVVPALWSEDLSSTSGLQYDAATAGTSVTITVMASGPVRLPGDVNGDAAVNAGDINAFTYALGHDAAGFNAFYPTGIYTNADVNGAGNVGDGAVNAGDINPFVALLAGHEPSLNALTAVPEPASIGLIGMGLVSLVARRRK